MNEEVNVQGLRMLLVEDDADSGKAMAIMLERRGVDVALARSVRAAIESFDPQEFDIVVADVRLGRASGVDVLRHIRRQAPRFPVIFMTGYDSLGTAIQAIRLRADDYILKPLVSIDDLLVPASKAVERAHLVEENQRLQGKLRALNAKLVLVEEEERRTLAEGLHDSIGQMLVACRLQVSHLAQRETVPETLSKLQFIEETLNQAIQETRDLVFDLSPPSLYDLGLPSALSMLAAQYRERHGLETEFVGESDAPPLPQDVNVVLYRAIRELLLNVLKHSQTKQATVQVWNDDSRVFAGVSDDGVGFDPAYLETSQGSAGSFGLISIREQIHHHGGSMTVRSAPGEGCTVALELPVPGNGQ